MSNFLALKMFYKNATNKFKSIFVKTNTEQPDEPTPVAKLVVGQSYIVKIHKTQLNILRFNAQNRQLNNSKGKAEWYHGTVVICHEIFNEGDQREPLEGAECWTQDETTCYFYADELIPFTCGTPQEREQSANLIARLTADREQRAQGQQS